MAELRHAFRILARAPGFTAIVILILAVGIGANTAMFSLIDGVLLRPLPFPDSDRLYAVQEHIERIQGLPSALPVSAMHFREWRKRWTAGEQIALFNIRTASLTTGGEPRQIVLARASATLFPLLGVEPQIGRNFLPEEDAPGRDEVALITDRLWRERFHADPKILGGKILIDDVPYQVAGVLPPGLVVPKVSELLGIRYGEQDPDVWKPFAMRDQELSAMGDFNFACLAKLRPGISRDQALAELDSIQGSIVKEFVHEDVDLRAMLAPLQAQISGRSRAGLLLLMGAVGAVLLIVCVNVANLLLARSASRRREFAVRAALGASSARLARQIMTESFLLAAAGGVLGIAFAYEALRVIVASAPIDLPRVNAIHIDIRVLAAAAALTIGSAILFGLIPALREARSDPQDSLKAGGRSATEARRGSRLRSTLVMAEVALSTLPLMGAGLLLASFVKLMHVDRGFEVERITTVDLSFPLARYPDLRHRADFLKKLLENVAAIPGVTSAAVTNILPLASQGSNNILTADGTTLPDFLRPIADFRLISEGYFRTMSIPLLAGRAFEPADRDRKVAIVSAETAQRVWPGENPLGRKFHLGDFDAPLLEVVGVVTGVRESSLQQAPPLTVYIPYWQRNQGQFSLAVRAAMDPARVSNAVRQEIRKLDPEMPVPAFRSMRQIVSESVAQRQFQLMLVLLFAGAGLVLAGLGVYGVVSYSVEQRRGEMGIRMALGATGSGLRMMVLRQGLAPVAAGLVIGVAAAAAIGRVLQGMLFGVRFADPLTIAGVAAVLLATASAACYLPAARATRADPLSALRYE
ncbi:MAG TPA: ABC transporter permease [Bryobacteraceae bacterium]|jgi:predicted permease|nr:ABC transporter permease [Bryobacteraceae bacterium]